MLGRVRYAIKIITAWKDCNELQSMTCLAKQRHQSAVAGVIAHKPSKYMHRHIHAFVVAVAEHEGADV